MRGPPWQRTFGTDPIADSLHPRGQCLSCAGMPPIPAPFEHPCTRTSPTGDSSDTAIGAHRRSRAPVAGAKV